MVTRSVIRITAAEAAAAKAKASPSKMVEGSARNTFANNEIGSIGQSDMMTGCDLKHKKTIGKGNSDSLTEVAAKKCDGTTEEPTSNKKKRLRSNSFTIDLSDVPPQSPILKNKTDGRMKDRASKYIGVSLNKQSNKWGAYISIEGKSRYIGCYTNEEEAGIDYARAVYKYNGKEALDKARVQASQIKFEMDLSDIPSISPILKSGNRGAETSSRYVGVIFDKRCKRWKSQITVEGKLRFIGNYESEEKAAVDYARALLKYRGQEALDKGRKQAAQRKLDTTKMMA